MLSLLEVTFFKKKKWSEHAYEWQVFASSVAWLFFKGVFGLSQLFSPQNSPNGKSQWRKNHIEISITDSQRDGSKILKFASNCGYAVSVRSGGHNYAG